LSLVLRHDRNGFARNHREHQKDPNSATLSGSEIKKLNLGGKQKYAAAKALANEVRTPTVLP